MARVADYSQKVEALKEKIEKKTEQLKEMKNELKNLEALAAQQNMQDIASFIQEKKIDSAEVLNLLRERYGNEG